MTWFTCEFISFIHFHSTFALSCRALRRWRENRFAFFSFFFALLAPKGGRLSASTRKRRKKEHEWAASEWHGDDLPREIEIVIKLKKEKNNYTHMTMSRCLRRWRSHRHANLIADADREHSPTSHNKVYSRRASPPLTCSACSCSCANAPTTLSCSCDALSLGRWITAAVRRMWAVQSCAMTVTTCDDARCGEACWCCHSCRTVDSMRMRRPDWDCRRSWPWSDWLCTRARFRVFCAQLSLERRSSETILNELFSFFSFESLW